MARQSKGTVTVEAVKGRLRLRLPRHLYDGKQKYLTLGLGDTPQHRAIALAKAKQIEADIVLEQFDASLANYHTVKSAPVADTAAVIRVSEVGGRCVAYGTPISSTKTILDCYTPMGKHFAACPQALNRPLVQRQCLILG